jgi:hypothetical protein
MLASPKLVAFTAKAGGTSLLPDARGETCSSHSVTSTEQIHEDWRWLDQEDGKEEMSWDVAAWRRPEGTAGVA